MTRKPVRLDAQFATSPAILELVAAKKHRAAFAWVCSLAYSAAHETSGFLPENCLLYLHATEKDAADLVAAGLWREVAGGWGINDGENGEHK